MGIWQSSSSTKSESDVLEMLVPRAFRECVTDLSTEHLTDKEKEKIDKLVWRYAEAYVRSRQRFGEQVLLSDELFFDFQYS